jgi:uroporphyrin-III C-methyltransferase/precorrin-2 dehydrogenase/sirohydrochlorin ferrochelatase
VDYLPLFFDLRGKICLVVGGGEVAARKIELLCRAGAKVHIVAPVIAEQTQTLVERYSLSVEVREFLDADVTGMSLVVAATDELAVNQLVYECCNRVGTLINSVDHPALSNVIFPGIIDRSPVLVAVSTAGNSPTLARVVRGWIESRLPANLGRLAQFIGARRSRVQDQIASVGERQRFWEGIISGVAGERALSGDDEGAEQSFAQQLEVGRQEKGRVTLIGAGPGDPELMTLKGLRVLQSADVILYDNLVNAQILEYARRDAEKIYVGKKRKFPSIRQEAIHALLLEHTAAGRHVVRLKGGDPFIFGRGGEETQALAAAGIDCTVIPGITAASGSASYAGIPLTHRDVSQSVRFVTGHRASDRTNLDWPELAKSGQTLVIYMGLPGLEDILAKLTEHGLPAATPAALIEKATLPEQQVIVGDLSNLAVKVRAAEVVGPTTIIIGEVINYRLR